MTNIDTKKLPSPPGVAVKLLELYSADDVSLDEIGEVIGVDPVLTARIIGYANSPKFARRYAAASLGQAIALLGVNGVKMFALSFSLTETKGEEAAGFFNFQEFWKSSLATAVCGRNVFEAIGLDQDSGFLLGLLFNVGQLAIATSVPEQYGPLLSSRDVKDVELIKQESAELGLDRYAVAVQVLQAWNFPEKTIEAFETGEQSVEFRSLRLATELSYSFLDNEPGYEVVQSVSASLSELPDFDEERCEEFYAKTLAEYAEMAEILAYSIPPQKSLKEIELEAKTRILELTMDLHQANTQAVEENSELKNLAYYDVLTGLGNRRQYDRNVQAEYDRSNRMGIQFGLLVCDIDFFKKVNDVYGHAAGDKILVGVAGCIQDGTRTYDHVFRFGGEEFVVMVPDTDVESLKIVAERIRKAVESETFEYEGTKIQVTISLGGAIYCGQRNPVTLDELFQKADEALYTAKKSGRNQFQLDLLPAGNVLPLPTTPNSKVCMTDHELT